ncbi:MAG: VPLPA-CTERM sorting domain-containing protein [Nitrospira sp.]|nr:MAG: VPLPA-CTERM sorting domain-containing protein [Nitrospira sp.]
MIRTHRLKLAVAGLFAASALALGPTAQAVTLNAGVFAVGNGDLANPVVLNIPDPGLAGGSGIFLDTINFDLGSFTHFNMTSVATGITAFGSTIFENNGDSELPVTIGGYQGAADTFTALALADLGLTRDYHLHPAGLVPAGVGYTLTLWGSNAGGPGVPLPAAAWLFGSGVIGLASLARRKMMGASA